ncbi:MAG: ascorbate-dependent monooxygenase [Blastocatellia bacterium]|nr:ascorbate-dependent monooxygenase [Blastocatellia bacterium]
MTYEESKPYALAIKDATASHRMPPWKAAAGCGDFYDARILSKDQVETLARWADAGAPEGDPKDLPAPKDFPTEWLLGKPDLELKSPEPYPLKASGDDVYRCFVFPQTNDEDRYVTAAEILPDAAAVVHHVLLFIDSTGESLKLDAKDSGPGYTSFGGPGFTPTGGLGGWAPGNFPRFAPKGIGIKWPKNSRIVMQVHYHPNGKEQLDQTKLGLHFATEPVESTLSSIPVVNPFFRIPAGAERYQVKARFVIPPTYDIKAIGITPHMHLLGKEMKVTARLPNGKKICLVNIPAWDFRWQGTYTYQEPVSLPGGTIIEATTYYDNSSKNGLNPNNPPKDVRWGEQTTDEMCLCFVSYILDRKSSSATAAKTINQPDELQRQIALQPPVLMGGVNMLEQANMKLAGNLLSTSPVEMYNWSDSYQQDHCQMLPWRRYFAGFMGKDVELTAVPKHTCH